jgi:hypothetical protein
VSCSGLSLDPHLTLFDRAAGESGYEDVTQYYVDDWHTVCQFRRLQRGWSEKNLKLVRRLAPPFLASLRPDP